MDHFSVVLDPSLDDAFSRLAGKNYLSHCIKRNDATHTMTVSQHTVTASKLKLQARSTVRYSLGRLS